MTRISAMSPEHPSGADRGAAVSPSGAAEAINGEGGELPPGTLAGNCVIERFVAQGGCGAIYAATHTTLTRRVAVKVLHRIPSTSSRMLERFLREVEVIRLLNHPDVVEIYESGWITEDRPFYVMEYLEGLTVSELLRRRGRLSPTEALDLLEPVCNALSAAHAAGIIHRDVKASNVFVVEGESEPVTSAPTHASPRLTPRVKLFDFGIAKLLASSELGSAGLTSVGKLVGTITIMAPEQLLGQTVDERIDIYALGVLLYRTLTGKLPFSSTNYDDLVQQHLEAPAPRPSRWAQVTPELDAVVLRCLEKRPEHRFGSVQSFVEALRGAVKPPDARIQPHEVEAPAIGVHAQLHVHSDRDELDEALVDDLGRALDLIEKRLQDARFILVSATENEILAILPLSTDPAEGLRARQRTLDVLASLHETLTQRPGADPRIDVALCVHVGSALLRGADGREVVGGDLVHTSEWSLEGDGPGGLYATEDAVQSVSGFEITPGPKPLVAWRRRG